MLVCISLGCYRGWWSDWSIGQSYTLGEEEKYGIFPTYCMHFATHRDRKRERESQQIGWLL